MIELYINKYYEKLYKNEPFDETLQNNFLDLINNKISDTEKETLETNVTENEIYTGVKKNKYK